MIRHDDHLKIQSPFFMQKKGKQNCHLLTTLGSIRINLCQKLSLGSLKC